MTRALFKSRHLKAGPMQKICPGFWMALLLILIGFTACTDQLQTPSPAGISRNIRIDGDFDDWIQIPVAIDDLGDASNAELDLGQVSLHSDMSHIFLKINFHRELNLQRLDGTLMLLIDGDGNQTTGSDRHGLPGVDLIVYFSPEDPEHPDRPHMGVGVDMLTLTNGTTNSKAVGHSDIGFMLAPTYAANQVECRLDRNTALTGIPPMFQGDHLNLKWVLTDTNRLVTDQTDTLSHALTAQGQLAANMPGAVEIPSTALSAMRAMSWNVEYGNILKVPEISGRILKALNPDVILLQELTSANSGPMLETFFNETLHHPDHSWQVIFGQGGGRLRCAIASRFPLEPVAAFHLIPYPNDPNRHLRVAGATISFDHKKILLASVHLKCCGRVGSEEDQTRIKEAGLIRQAVQDAMGTAHFDGVVIGGDFNLVGGYAPLELLGKGLDPNQNDLAVVDSYHLDGTDNATWAKSSLPFVPGRLDYFLVSESSLSVAQSFIFDSTDFSKTWFSNQAMPDTDSAKASDHFPILVDLRAEP
jgi:endonuclease/exonuclease/phosphatase family metal-dependent hydrolase